jgi:hypothetical protein
MSAIAMCRLGYNKVHTFDPSSRDWAVGITDKHVPTKWSNAAVLMCFSKAVDATFLNSRTSHL